MLSARKFLSRLPVLTILLGGAALAAATATVNSAAGYAITSDGQGSYVDNVACVTVTAGQTGVMQLRTVKNDDGCNLQGPAERRTLTLNGGAGFDLDLDQESGDTDPTVEKIPARFIATRMFKRRRRYNTGADSGVEDPTGRHHYAGHCVGDPLCE